ncbi:unnamed protein product [Camellia sinensis]
MALGYGGRVHIIDFDAFDPSSYSIPPVRSPDEAIAVSIPIWACSNSLPVLPSLLRFIKQLSPKIMVSMDRGCERTEPLPSNLRKPVVSRNPLSSLLLADDKEGLPCQDEKNPALRTPEHGNNNRELKDEGRFLKAYGTLLETPPELREGSGKFTDLSCDGDSEPSKFHSWLPNTSIEKLKLEKQPDQPPTPINLSTTAARFRAIIVHLSGGSISADKVQDNYKQYWSFFRCPKEIELTENVPAFVLFGEDEVETIGPSGAPSPSSAAETSTLSPDRRSFRRRPSELAPSSHHQIQKMGLGGPPFSNQIEPNPTFLLLLL